MASPSDEHFERCSTSSSLEIVDALTEAAEDTPDQHLQKESSPAESVLSCPDLVMVEANTFDDFQDAMTTSQYAQVIFEDIADSYLVSGDLVCSYSLTPGLEPGHGDRVGLYRLPFLQPHESVCYVWAAVGQGLQHKVTFKASRLPRQEDFYQFQYLRGDNGVAGASIPFQLRLEPGERALQEELGGLETKYTSLLHHSETLQKELEVKQQSFVVLEQQHKSMQEEAKKKAQMEADLAELVAARSELKQTLRATEETLGRTEAVLEATTFRLQTAEAALAVKDQEVVRLEAKLKEAVDGKEDRDGLAAMLATEQSARETLLKEKASLLCRLEDSEAMVAAAVRSKDLAVAEIRTQVAQQDELRRGLATAKEEAARAEADLVEARREIEARENALSSLGTRLEQKEEEVKQREMEVNVARSEAATKEAARMDAKVMEVLQGEEEVLEIHERCLEDADKRAQVLEVEKRSLEEKVERLEVEGQELRARLEAGAKHYRKLAAAKEKLEKQQGEGERVAALEEQVRHLREELKVSRAAQEMQLCSLSRQVSRCSSLGATGLNNDSPDFPSLSSEGNMDSAKIGEALSSSSHKPSLFQPFPLPPSSLQSSTPSLPPPLLPEVAPAPASVPELLPRQPAPYNMTGEGKPEEDEKVHCPWCDAAFPAGGQDLEIHVEQHLAQVLDCPVCGKMFDKEKQQDYEEHVQQHFPEQGQSLVDISIRGWDLGID